MTHSTSPDCAQTLPARLLPYFILVAVGLLIGIAVLFHGEHVARARALTSAVRPALVTNDLARAYQTLRPGLHDGFVRIILRDKRGNSRLDITKAHASLRGPTATVRRMIRVDPRRGRSEVLALVDFNYAIEPPVLLLGGLVLVLALLFEVLRRSLSARSALSRAQDIIAAERRLVEQVAHDLRSPLTAFTLTLNRDQHIGPHQKSLLISAARRLGDIVDDMAPAAAAPTDSVCDVVRVVREVFDETRAAHVALNHVRWTIDVSEHAPRFCRGHTKDIARVVSNLLINAVEALTGPGAVSVALKGRPGAIDVVIKDEGRGIPSALMTRLGRGRVSEGKIRSPGRGGLGLMHAFEVAKLFGGSLKIDSAPGIGTAATLTLRPA